MAKPKNLKAILEVSAAVIGILGAIIGITNDLWDLEDKKNEEVSQNQVMTTLGDSEEESSMSLTTRASEDSSISITGLHNDESNNSSSNGGEEVQTVLNNDSGKETSNNDDNSTNENASSTDSGNENSSNAESGNSDSNSMMASDDENVISGSVSVEKIDSNVICACVTNDGYAYLNSSYQIIISNGTTIDISDLGYSGNLFSKAILLYNCYDDTIYFVNCERKKVNVYSLSDSNYELVYQGEASGASFQEARAYYEYFMPSGELFIDGNLYDLESNIRLGDVYNWGWCVKGVMYNFYDRGIMEVGTNVVSYKTENPEASGLYDDKLYWVEDNVIWSFDGTDVTEELDLSDQQALSYSESDYLYIGKAGYIWLDKNSRMYFISQSSL